MRGSVGAQVAVDGHSEAPRALLDFPRYPEWNPFVRSIEGLPSPGSPLKVSIAPPGGKPLTFRLIVLHSSAPQEFRWKGKLLLPGLFDGEHYFRLVPADDGSTQFMHGERFTGLLVPLLRSQLDRGTRAGFEAMNAALKQRVEHQPPFDLGPG